MLKRKITLFIGILVLALFIIGCGQEQPIEEQPPQEKQTDSSEDQIYCAQDVKECPDGSYVSRDPENGCQFRPCPDNELPTEKEGILSDEIKAMQEKAKQVNSYEFLDWETNDIILRKDNQSVIITSNANKYRYDGISFNSIFIDHSDKTAYAVCLLEENGRNPFKCIDDTASKYIEVPYSDFDVKNPYKPLMELNNGEVTGTRSCENRQCDIIEYTKDNNNMKMFVRKVYYMPYKVIELDEEGNEEIVDMFTNVGFNHLKEKDVTIPENYEEISGE